MNLLVYCWKYFQETLFCKILDEMETPYIKLDYEAEKCHCEDKIIQELIHKENIGAIFSYNYFPVLARVCEIKRIPYISWVCEYSQDILQSETISSPYNYIFCLDRIHAEQMQQMGAKHCEYYPISVDTCYDIKSQIIGMFEIVRRLWYYDDSEKMSKVNADIQWLKEYVDICMHKGNFVELVKTLRENRSVIKEDDDLSNLYYLSGVYEKEKQTEKITLYKENMEETLEVFHELQRRVRRLEWWEDYSPQEIYLYMIERKLSVYELQWAVETTCVDKAKVWRLLNEN